MMLPTYSDITNLAEAVTGKRPLWWTKEGAPRFEPFHPEMLGVYDHWAALYEVECGDCKQKLNVGVGWTMHQEAIRKCFMLNKLAKLGLFEEEEVKQIFTRMEDGKNTLKDTVGGYRCDFPPAHKHDGEICSGISTYSPTKGVVQVWERKNFNWLRRVEMEGSLINLTF